MKVDKIKNDVAVTRSWTWEELAAAIKKCGGKPDNEALEHLARELETCLEGGTLLDSLMAGVEIEPTDETAKALSSLGVSLPDCGLCECLEDGYCWHYCEKKTRESWNEGLDCFHFATSEPKRILWYEDVDFHLPVISLTGKFPDAKDIVKALRTNLRWVRELDEVSAMVDDVEDIGKWRLE